MLSWRLSRVGSEERSFGIAIEKQLSGEKKSKKQKEKARAGWSAKCHVAILISERGTVNWVKAMPTFTILYRSANRQRDERLS